MSDEPPPPPPLVAPILSTQEDTSQFTAAAATPSTSSKTPRYSTTVSTSQFREIYEIDRTVREVREKGYRNVALQFPDELLGDSTKVYGMISEGVNEGRVKEGTLEGKNSSGKGKMEGEGCCGGRKEMVGEGEGCCKTGDSGEVKVGCCGGGGVGGTVAGKVADGKGHGNGDESNSGLVKLFILADTSYGACCVDEIAAEHVDADVVVHYGRACLSPTARLPVIHVFTVSPLSRPSVVATFKALYPPTTALNHKIILMADVTYHAHLPAIHSALTSTGYTNLHLAEIIHDPSSPLPNRTLPAECQVLKGENPEERDRKMRILREEWEVFHISTPLPSLLLVLSSRLKGLSIYPTDATTVSESTTSTTTNEDVTDGVETTSPLPLSQTTPLPILPLLRRRYALLTHLRTASIIGILVSTLSIKNYLPLLSLLKRLIRSAGKKSYLVVVGKVNVEKLANFAEVEGWVGVGCWEQGVVGGALTSAGGGREYYRPVVTPWELGVALRGMGNEGQGEEEEEEDEEEEVGVDDGEIRQRKKINRWQWNGEWITDFEELLSRDEEEPLKPPQASTSASSPSPSSTSTPPSPSTHPSTDLQSHPDSAPPEFNLRTGRYVSDSRPLAHIPVSSSTPTTTAITSAPPTTSSSSTALTTQSQNTSLTHLDPVGGVISPAARFLREKRGWRGLGSVDVGYEEEEEEERRRKDGGEGAVVETGRSGVARGYGMVGEGEGAGRV